MRYRNDITAEYVRSILDYSPETGVFTWKHRVDVGVLWNNKWAGKTAGTAAGRYITIIINRCHYSAHRLAWLWMTGNWPVKYMDHVDLDKKNNKWNNLREATRSENNINIGIRSNNNSGATGVCLRTNQKSTRWRAKINVNGRQIHLGHFINKLDAKAAYDAAALTNYGEFARTE